jgi:hypothetical protein
MQSKKTIRDRVEDKKAQQKKLKDLKFTDFLIDMKHNPMIIIGLGGSAFFTFLAGLFLGVAPRRVGGEIQFFGGNGTADAVIGILFGIVYAVMFPVLGEYGVFYWHKKASLRDDDNRWQAIISYSMLVLTAIFMIVTAVFASTILASLLSSFKVFAEIPEAAQRWTVTIIPVGLGLHAFANIWYDHKSKAAEERRELERGLQAVEIESEGRIREARVHAKEMAAIAHADEYERLSESGARQAGKQRAHAHWNHDRVEFGASNEPEGFAGKEAPRTQDSIADPANLFSDTEELPDELPIEIPQPTTHPATSTIDNLLFTMKMSADEARTFMKSNNINNAETAWAFLKANHLRPDSMTFKDFNLLYAELMAGANPL